MSSPALQGLEAGIEEVKNLQKANPTPLGGLPARPPVVRAINRASVVLLSSHLERYLRALNEQAVAELNAAGVDGVRLPLVVRLQHSHVGIDALVGTQWENRGELLQGFAESDAWLWSAAPRGELAPEKLLCWMKSPSPQRIRRLFAMWGVEDIFSAITRQPHTRSRLWLKLDELVTKRNNIAHGDVTAEATYQDIASYLSVVRTFCVRADVAMARALVRITGARNPW